MSDVLLMGEAMALFVADTEGSLEEVDKYTRTVSGAEVNVSIGLSRLGFNPMYLTRLGDDELGRYIATYLKKENINTEAIQFDSVNRTGIQLKSKVSFGDAAAPYFRKGSAASKIDEEALDHVSWESIKILHITGVPLALSSTFRSVIYKAIEEAKKRNILITFDPNIRHNLWSSKGEMCATLLYVASQCDIFLPGLAEAEYLADVKGKDAVFDFFSKMGVSKMIMKLGPKGSYVFDEGIRTVVPGFVVEKVVDTVGAGDGFAAGVLSSILENESLTQAALRGNAMGAIQVMHWSDNQGLPNRDTLMDFMKHTEKETV